MKRLMRQCRGHVWRQLQRPGCPVRPGSLLHYARLIVAAVITVAALAAPAAAAAQEARGTITGTVQGRQRRRHPGRHRHHHQRRDGHHGHRRHQRRRRLPGAVPDPRHLPRHRRAAGLQEGGARSRAAHRRSARRRPLAGAGAATETVNVTADTPLLETTNASLGNVVDSRRISQLPTPHGDPYALIGLAAGVTYTGSARLDRPFEPTHIVGYAMDGTRGNRSDLTIDGVPSTATANAGEVIASYVPPADIVQEFKVQTATFDAASGNTEGGVDQPDDQVGHQLAARAPSTSARRRRACSPTTSSPTPTTSRSRTSTTTATAAPPAVRWCCRATTAAAAPSSCTASRASTSRGRATTARRRCRPRRCATATSRSCWRSGRSTRSTTRSRAAPIGNGRFQQDPFPGNIIPQNLINPVARAALEYFGRPLTAGNADGTSNFQNPSLPEEIKYANNTIRIDHNLTDKQRMYGRVSWYDRNSNYNNYFNNLATGEWFKFVSRQVALDHVYALDAEHRAERPLRLQLVRARHATRTRRTTAST